MPTLKEWAKVTRIQTAAVTMLSLWAGHIVVEPLTLESTLILGGVGLSIHIWGFTLNEVYDAEYDEKHGESTGHPIVRGVITKEEANVLAWASGATGLLLYMIAVGSPLGILALILSFGHGMMYNLRSKKDWFSNVYLAAWVFFMVIAGAMSAGQFSFPVLLVGIILAIQIFVQVIEGDLKDLTGPEDTFAEKLGVRIDFTTQTIEYPKTFTMGLVFWKTGELVLIYILLMQSSLMPGLPTIAQLVLFFTAAAIFGRTLRGWLVEEYDRDEIKEQSSKHELASIVLLGIALWGYDVYGAVLVALIPVVWYLGVNVVIHRGSLNPDI